MGGDGEGKTRGERGRGTMSRVGKARQSDDVRREK